MKQVKKYVGLSDAERSEIATLIKRKLSIREIAKALERSPNTISREIKVNSVTSELTGIHSYNAKKAKTKSRESRRSRRFQWQKIEQHPRLRLFIIEKLQRPNDWSPKAISGYLKHQQPDQQTKLPYVSTMQIYEWLYSSRGQPYCQYLCTQRYRRKKRTKKTERVMIPDRVSIDERPQAVQERTVIGSIEFDSIVSSKRSRSTYALAVVQERTTRLINVKIVANLKPEPYAGAIVGLTNNMKVTDYTTDNGIENKHHTTITKATEAIVYFCDPYSSYQKGGVENANKMIRRYFPKGTDFSKVTQAEVDTVVKTINNKPRQCLGFKSALQCAIEKGLLLDPSVLLMA